MGRAKKTAPARFPAFQAAFVELMGDMTIQEFADKLGMSRATVGFYSAGQRIPDALGIKTIAEKCGVSADWLLGLSSNKTTDADLKGVCTYTGLSENAIKNILQIMEEKKCRTADISPGCALDMIIGDREFASFIRASADFVGRGSRDPYNGEFDEVNDALLNVEEFLREQFHFDFYVACGTEVRDRLKGNAVDIISGILDNVYYDNELKKRKPTEERLLGEVQRDFGRFEQEIFQAIKMRK